MWCEATSLLLPHGGAIAGLSAAWLWGVDLLPLQNPPIVVAIPHQAAQLHPRQRLTIIRTTLPAEDVTTIDEMTVTTPERTAFDLGRLQSRVEAVVALDAMLHRRLITKERLHLLAEKRGRMRGLPNLKVALELADPRAESPMETRVRLLLHDAGLPMPVLQHEIYHRGRFLARVDFAYREQRVVIEYEGDYHRERSAFRFDLARVNDLVAAGWHVIRVTADDIHVRPGQFTGRVRAALAVRTG